MATGRRRGGLALPAVARVPWRAAQIWHGAAQTNWEATTLGAAWKPGMRQGLPKTVDATSLQRGTQLWCGVSPELHGWHHDAAQMAQYHGQGRAGLAADPTEGSVASWFGCSCGTSGSTREEATWLGWLQQWLAELHNIAVLLAH
ncbi:hypothetical protein E2562_029444 [Oryza meyeriana var. granulata]|uniref:Uncharacterized protein n=1 Tax=Oryza meyeriana var. granulata TaxID=110450 RepID=A0A6G1E408_9ORYZ|nr:hypothetical protein E2562_029444 [Oryza meyeriana var. granulata]